MLTPPPAAPSLAWALAGLLSGHALAYIGPGAGLGGIAVLVALSLGVLLLVIGLVWYPLKRLLRGRSKDPAGDGGADDAA